MYGTGCVGQLSFKACRASLPKAPVTRTWRLSRFMNDLFQQQGAILFRSADAVDAHLLWRLEDDLQRAFTARSTLEELDRVELRARLRCRCKQKQERESELHWRPATRASTTLGS